MPANIDEMLSFGQDIASKQLATLNLSNTQINNFKQEIFQRLDNALRNKDVINKLGFVFVNDINFDNIKKIAISLCLEIIGTFEISEKLNISREYIHFKDDIFYINNKSSKKKMIDETLLEVYFFGFGNFEFFEYDLRFYDCCFKSNMVQFPNMQKDYSYLSFIRCKFLNPIYLPNYEKTINHIIEMKDCIFCEKVTIKKVFNENIYFNNSTFKGYVDFHESEFNKTACFYGTTFEKTPNFSQVIFKGNLNLVNSNLNFGFGECEKAFMQALSIQKEREIEIQGLTPTLPQKAPEKTANDFRDSFRIFKNALIKENNLLDASNYHKIELYFKEIELKHKEFLNLSEKIDLWLLKFYRCVCSHHTNLLQAFNSLIILIGVFAFLNFGIVFAFDYFCFSFFEPNPHALFEFYNVHIKDFVVNHYIMILCANFVLLLFFIVLFLCSIFCSILRKIVLVPCYLFALLLLISSPKYLIPAISIFTDKRLLLDPLSINGSLYTILFGFIIYSFIKTARRNSIIPA